MATAAVGLKCGRGGGAFPVSIPIVAPALTGLDLLLILLFRAKSVKLAEISASFRQ